MKISIFGNFIPTITMLLTTIVSLLFNSKDLLIVGVVVIIPISFFIEGVVCARKRIGFIIPLILSLIEFFIIDKIVLFMHDSLYLYLMYYGVVYILGYVLEKLILRLSYILKKYQK